MQLMRRICRVLPLLAVAAWGAEKKPVTIQNLPAPVRMPPITWAPDGKRFAWMEDKAIFQYDVPSKKRKQLVTLGPLEDKAVKPPKPEGTDWQNRRVSEQSFQWSSTGQEMLISLDGDLFLLHTDTAKWEQLTATPEVERDPKLSPDGHFVSFRRDHDLYCLEVASGARSRGLPAMAPPLCGTASWTGYIRKS